jgi:hypothetical protein
MDPPGGTIATSRSNALQLFVYISLTSALGTSAFLSIFLSICSYNLMIRAMPRLTDPSTSALFVRVLCWVWEEAVQSCGEVVLAGVSITSIGPKEKTASEGEGQRER